MGKPVATLFALAGMASGFDDPIIGEGDWLASSIRLDANG